MVTGCAACQYDDEEAVRLVAGVEEGRALVVELFSVVVELMRLELFRPDVEFQIVAVTDSCLSSSRRAAVTGVNVTASAPMLEVLSYHLLVVIVLCFFGKQQKQQSSTWYTNSNEMEVLQGSAFGSGNHHQKS